MMSNVYPNIRAEIKAYTYSDYLEHIEQLVTTHCTSGSEQNKERIQSTKLNLARMKRWNKVIHINSEIESILRHLQRPQFWVVLTEAWCGDSAQIVPAINALAEASVGKIKLKLIFRDANPELMKPYETDGKQAIPKLISRDRKGRDLFVWGPRPKEAAKIIAHWKRNQDTINKQTALENLHKWYAQNNQSDTINEIIELINTTQI